MTFVSRFKRLLAAGFVFVLLAAPAAAINVVIDYTYDSNNFFGAGNPGGAMSGMQARAALEAGATYFSTILDDTFSAIVTPPTFHSSVFDGQVSWEWTKNLTHPGNGSAVVLTNPPVPANEYRIYAGARSLGGNTAGTGGPGGYGWSSNPSGGFTSQEIDEIDAITATFSDQVEHREETSGFASWGGVLTFDRDGSTTWHYNHTTAPAAGATDFYSVVLHELTHSFGFGSSDEFQSFVSGSSFVGANAVAEYGGSVPLSGNAHWAFDTTSTVYGTATSQEAAMDPDVLNGTRKFFTDLDAAALTDLGWQLVAPPPMGVSGDYNGNATVDAADYVLWRNGGPLQNDPTPGVQAADYSYWRSRFGTSSGSGSGNFVNVVPEPTTLAPVSIACVLGLLARRTRLR